MPAIANAFNEAMLDLYKITLKQMGRRGNYFLRMVTELGGVEAARLLIMTDPPSEGFSYLWEAKRLDLSAEALALKPEWSSLFSEAELDKARKRLGLHGFDPDTFQPSV